MKGYYINLEHRKDRKEHIEILKYKYPFFKEITRFDAIKDSDGSIGCAKSHIRALSQLYVTKEKYYIVLEDDFCILNKKNFIKFEEDFLKIKDLDSWDVLVLTPRGIDVEKNFLENFSRIKDTQTASGYIIKHNFIPVLIENFKECITALEEKKDRDTFALDQNWKKLQKTSNFIYHDRIYAGQLEGYSDIEKRMVNYNSVFLQQN